MSQRIPAVVEDIHQMKGMYMRNTRDNKIYKITEVGREGVTAYQADVIDGPTFGPEISITWRAVKAIYNVMVQLTDIETKGLH